MNVRKVVFGRRPGVEAFLDVGWQIGGGTSRSPGSERWQGARLAEVEVEVEVRLGRHWSLLWAVSCMFWRRLMTERRRMKTVPKNCVLITFSLAPSIDS